MRTLVSELIQVSGVFSESRASGLSADSQGTSWDVEDFIKVHKLVRKSGKHNFESCKIPIPTAIRHDNISEALGEKVIPKEERVLSLLEFSFPIDCKPNSGVKKVQRNHFSAISYKKELNEYLSKNVESKAMLSPFEQSPIED